MATNNTAFEAPESRFAWYCEEPINKYEPVIINDTGTLSVATASTLSDKTKLIGVCQYGSERAGDMVTVVKGAFPVVADAAITAGSLVIATNATVEVNGFTYHTCTAATSETLSSATVVGVALTEAKAKGELVTVFIK